MLSASSQMLIHNMLTMNKRNGDKECFVLQHVDLQKHIAMLDLQWYGYCLSRPPPHQIPFYTLFEDVL